MFDIQHYEKMESYIPIDLSVASHFIIATGVIFLFISVRYFLCVAPFYFYFWSSKNKLKRQSYLHNGDFDKEQIQTEIFYSVVSGFIFAIFGSLIGWLWQKGYTSIYLKIDQYGYLYLLLSFIFISIIHEIYFYSTHVLFHHKLLFNYIHRVHHLSKKVSPWASFSFHPIEAFFQALFLPLVVLFVPLHPLTLIAYMLFMTLTAISNHLGVELIKNRFILKYFISGEHHSFHHTHYKYNFGLYYRFMDQIFKTEKKERI